MASPKQTPRRWWSIALLALAGLEAWVARRTFPHHPYLAVANAAMALILVLGVILTW